MRRGRKYTRTAARMRRRGMTTWFANPNRSPLRGIFTRRQMRKFRLVIHNAPALFNE